MNGTNKKENARVLVIGGGLAGCEAAYYLAKRGVKVTLADMKPKKYTPAHESPLLSELVCSNSLKSNDVYANACGLLKEEMRILGSLTMEAAAASSVPAGGALAVDREKFAAYVTKKIKAEPNVTVIGKEYETVPDVSGDEYVFVATGHGVQSRRLSDESEISRTKARVFHDSRFEKRRISALRRNAPQFVYSLPRRFESRFHV